MKPHISSNEAKRLRSLRLYRILDSGSEKAFDDLTQLAAAICETPISLIILIESERQWLKSKVGVTLTQTRTTSRHPRHVPALLEVHAAGLNSAYWAARASIFEPS